jgi:hypothetical protein
MTHVMFTTGAIIPFVVLLWWFRRKLSASRKVTAACAHAGRLETAVAKAGSPSGPSVNS